MMTGGVNKKHPLSVYTIGVLWMNELFMSRLHSSDRFGDLLMRQYRPLGNGL